MASFLYTVKLKFDTFLGNSAQFGKADERGNGNLTLDPVAKRILWPNEIGQTKLVKRNFILTVAMWLLLQNICLPIAPTQAALIRGVQLSAAAQYQYYVAACVWHDQKCMMDRNQRWQCVAQTPCRMGSGLSAC